MPRFTHWTPFQKAMAEIAIKVVEEKYTFADYRKGCRALRLKWWRKGGRVNDIFARLNSTFPEEAFPWIQLTVEHTSVILKIFPLTLEADMAVPLFGVNTLPKLLQLATKSSRQKDYRKVIVKTALDLEIISKDDSRDSEIHDWRWVYDKILAAIVSDAGFPQAVYAVNVVIDTNSFEEIDLVEWEKPNKK